METRSGEEEEGMLGGNPRWFSLPRQVSQRKAQIASDLWKARLDKMLFNVLRSRDDQGWGQEVVSRSRLPTRPCEHGLCTNCQAKNQLPLRVVASIPSRSPSYFEAPPSTPPPDSHPITSRPDSATTNSTSSTSPRCRVKTPNSIALPSSPRDPRLVAAVADRNHGSHQAARRAQDRPNSRV